MLCLVIIVPHCCDLHVPRQSTDFTRKNAQHFLYIGRKEVTTQIVNENKKREVKKMFTEAKAELDSGGRVFIVCCLIDSSQKDMMANVKSVQEEYETMQVQVCKGVHIFVLRKYVYVLETVER